MPNTKPGRVCSSAVVSLCASSDAGLCSVSLAIPKSSTFTYPSGRSMMFSGLMSRCTTPASCAAASAEATCTAISSAACAFILPHVRRAQGHAFDEFHRDELPVALRADLINRENVWMKNIMQWLTKPPVDGPRSVLLLRLMVGGVFFWEGALKFVYVNQGVGRFTKLGMPFPAFTADFVGCLEIVGGLLLPLRTAHAINRHSLCNRNDRRDAFN